MGKTYNREEAWEILSIAEEFFEDGVIGIELSGNPHVYLFWVEADYFQKGNFEDFIPVLEKARELSIPISLHFAESKNYEESKVAKTVKC